MATPPAQIVIVCLGNICRSPYAGARLRLLLDQARIGLPVASAGLIGPGRPADATGSVIARARGISLADHQSRLLTRQPPNTLLVLMDPAHSQRVRKCTPNSPLLVLGDLDPSPITTRRIQDPFGYTPDVFLHAFDRIDRCLAVLATLLRNNLLGDDGPGDG